MDKYIKISEFIEHLKQNDLIIVDRRLIDYHKPDISALLQKRSVTIKQLADSGVLPVKSKQAIRNWIDAGKIRKDAVFTDKNGVVRIARTEILRLIKTYTNYEQE